MGYRMNIRPHFTNKETEDYTGSVDQGHTIDSELTVSEIPESGNLNHSNLYTVKG